MKIEIFLDDGRILEYGIEPFWKNLKGKIKAIHINGVPANIGKRCILIFHTWSIMNGPSGHVPFAIFEDDGYWIQPLPNGDIYKLEEISDEIKVNMLETV